MRNFIKSGAFITAILWALASCQMPLTLIDSPQDSSPASSAIPLTVSEATRAITEPNVPEFFIFFKSTTGVTPHAYVWYSSNSQTVQPFGAWNSTDPMTAIGNNWYMVDLRSKNVPMNTNVGVIIKDAASVKLSGNADLFRNVTGWLRMESGSPRWYADNPEAGTTGKPTVTLSPIDNTISGSKTFTVTINDGGYPLINKSYSLNDTSYSLTGNTFVVDGNAMAPGQSVSIMVKAMNVNGKTVEGPHVFTKPAGTTTMINIYFKSPWSGTAPTLWLWEGAGTNTTNVSGTNRAIMALEGMAWPGPAMLKNSATDWWYWTIPSKYYPLSSGLKMKFNQGAEVSLTGAVSASKWYNGTTWFSSNPDTAPTVSATPAGGYFSGSVTVTLKAANPGNAYYRLGAGAETAYQNNQTITFGSAMADSETITLKLIGDQGRLIQDYIFTKQPSASQIKVNVKGYSKVYYWAYQPATALAATTWPGVNLSAPDASGWRSFTMNNVTSTNLIFSAPDGTVSGILAQTPDLTRTTGVWWYKGGQWFDSDPDNTPPVVTASPETAVSNTAITVVLDSSQATDKLYYTTNGSTPTASSALYNGPLTISSTVTLKVKGLNSKNVWGTVYSFNYTVDPNLDLTKPTITTNVTPGAYTSSKLVRFTFADNKAGVTAYYTTNGTQPTTATTTKFTSTTTSGSSSDFNVNAPTEFLFLVRDAAGNETRQSFYYYIGAADTNNDFRDETIYFVMTTRFYDGDTTNNKYGWDDAQAGNVVRNDPSWRGDFKGLIEKLDYIKALGFSALWITPVVANASGYDYHGYHAINHKEVDPRYLSTGVTYQTLINAAHAKGIKIVQDIVLNHTSNFGEENLFPLFKKDWPNISGINGDTPAKMQKIAPLGVLPTTYDTLTPGQQFGARIAAMKEDANDPNNIYHHEKSLSWESYTVQTGQIAGDCVDLNTENPVVSQYLRDAYYQYIDMGVDAFRIDTVKHISRLTFNKEFIPQFKARGGQDFYIFGEVATRYRQVWNSGIPAISTPFFTWKESKTYSWGNRLTNEASVFQNWQDYSTMGSSGEYNSNNHQLNGNTYHTPDWSKRSGLDVIDFPMHWNFANARDAFGVALGGDHTYSDATWNVTYIDSHDYAPDTAPENQRFALPQHVWAENLSLIFTFRGIPTIYYGSEIEFKKGAMIDVGPNAPLETTGRAYFGNNITGSLSVSGFGKYSNATGNVATTLNHPLAQHIRQLNLIRRAIPALRRGQYSTDGIGGSGMAFKRRYTNTTVDSFALVVVSGDATFSGIPNGTYKDAVTGDTKTVTNGSLYANASGSGNLRVYVLSTTKTPAPGKIVDTAGLTYIK